MIAVDTQILVYAHLGASELHPVAKLAIEQLANSGTSWAIPVHCLVEFYATVTNPRKYKRHSTPAQAIDQTEAWLESPELVILAENAQTWTLASELLLAARVAGNRAYDARIAAVCLQHGVTELWTNDTDYLAFPSLRVRNPLIGPPARAGEQPATYSPRRRGAAPPRRAAAAAPRLGR